MHLIGETVGGTISLKFASEYPERLLSVTTCTSPYKFVGNPTYLDSYNLVRDEGVEAWVRRTSERRLESGAADAAHQEWYINQMAQTQGPGGDGDAGIPVSAGPDGRPAGHSDSGAGSGLGAERPRQPRPHYRDGLRFSPTGACG